MPTKEAKRLANQRYFASEAGKKAITRGYEKRIAKAKAMMEERKANGCVNCGRQGPSYIFDFHHLDPATKLFNIASCGYHKSKESILEAELDKCVVLCAICHRMVTHGDLTLAL